MRLGIITWQNDVISRKIKWSLVICVQLIPCSSEILINNYFKSFAQSHAAGLKKSPFIRLLGNDESSKKWKHNPVQIDYDRTKE